MNQNQTIAMYQPMLQSIAYKMVGSLADAEDIVQDTLLKWLTVEKEKINNNKAYLIRAVKNNCINHLDSLKKKKDECLHTLNTELVDWYKEKELFTFDKENEINAALTVLQKKLEPLEKGIYVLREFFDFDYEDLQQIFNKKKDNCRQLFSRAKKKLSDEPIKDKATDQSLLQSFRKAFNFDSPEEVIEKIKGEIKKVKN